MLRRLVILGTAVSALLAAAAPANAGTISVSASDDVTFVARPGETNALEVPYPAATMIVTDAGAGLTAGAGCVPLGPNSADCGIHPNIDAYLGNKDDTAQVAWAGRVQIWAGPGNDSVVASSFGQHGTAYGEAGDDVLGVVGEGGQLADGGPGDDVLDVFAFGGQSTGIGGNGRDIIEFRSSQTTAIIPPTLDGGNGRDTIYAQPAWSGSGTVTGGRGDDTIVITSVLPLYGTGSSYLLLGGPGDDTVTGGVSIDTVDGGGGDDSIDVTDGGADTVTCGAGHDVVRYDPSDTVAADCEVLLG
jgi:Ca2+-binding RTX toxin-like protein